MELTFKDKHVRKLCENQAEAQKKLGSDCARKLRTRLADLEAAVNVSELTAGRPHPLLGDRKGQFAVDLAKGFRLVFAPNHDPCPQKNDQSIDWSNVTIICIEEIGDYHD